MDELDYLKEKISLLETEVDEMEGYFDRISSEIIKKCVLLCARAMRDETNIPCMVPAKYNYLNTFEQICLIKQKYNTDDYLGLESYIEETIDKVYNDLTIDEKFILHHGFSADPLNNIRTKLNRYCVKFKNKNIEKAHLN